MSGSRLGSIDGRLADPSELALPIEDDGLRRGDGAFEVVRVYGGHPFALEQHLARIARSAAAIELDFDSAALRDEIGSLLDAAADFDGALRLILTRGGHRIATLEPLPGWPESVTLAQVTWSPNEILAGVKSISYAGHMQATRVAAARGAQEAVLVRPDGVVLEAPTSAIFWAGEGGKLRTPALETGILDSITRAVLLEALEVDTGAFDVSELRATEEAFIASSTREVQPVAAIDGEPLAAVPGPLSGAASEALRAAIERERAAAG